MVFKSIGRNEQHDIFNFYVKVKIVYYIPTRKIKKGKNAQEAYVECTPF